MRELRDLIQKRRIDVACIQETKMEVMEEKVCKTIWGHRQFEWSYKGGEGNSGGILTMWNPEVFQKISEWHCRGMLVIRSWNGASRVVPLRWASVPSSILSACFVLFGCLFLSEVGLSSSADLEVAFADYKTTVEKVWTSSTKQGWSGFTLKERLKEVKIELKRWSKDTFGNLESRIEEKKEEIEKLDLFDDTFGLTEEEAGRRQESTGELMQEVAWNEKQLV
ncbi:hypothetical protein ACS0TY_002528 [Phlomoides rotata]